MSGQVADGRQEILERFAEACGQLVSNGLNQEDGFSHEQQLAIATALDRGARFRMVVELDPLAVVVQLAQAERAVEVFRVG